MFKRLDVLLKEVNLSPSQFADEIGVQKATISHIISGRNNPSLDFIQKVLDRFPEINAEWVINGKGDIWKTGAKDHAAGGSPALSSVIGQNRQSELFEEPAPVLREKHARENQKKVLTRQDEESRQDAEQTLTQSSVDGYTNGQQSDKEIVKVIILYSDHTFSAFDKESL